MNEDRQPELKLELTEANLLPVFVKKIPDKPRFFHFDVTAKAFHDATLITFTNAKGEKIVIKDTYSRTTK